MVITAAARAKAVANSRAKFKSAAAAAARNMPRKSKRAKQNLTNQLKAQLAFYRQDLAYDQHVLSQLRTLPANLAGVSSQIMVHKRAIRTTQTQIQRLKARIGIRYRRNEIFKIDF